MTLLRPLWMQPAGGDAAIEYSGVDDRLLIQSLFETEGPLSGLKVAQRAAGANFSVDIEAGQAIITGNDIAVQGSYLATSTAVENRTIPAPPGSGTRVHRVVAWVKDKLHDGAQTTYEVTLEVLEDTGSGTPAPPPSAITLATVSVTAGQASVLNSHITDLRINALPRPGRPRQVASDATRPAVPLTGELLWRTDRTDLEIYTGSAWMLAGINRPWARLKRTSNLTLTNDTVTTIGFDAEDADSHGGHDNASNNTRYTAQIAGVYRVTGNAPFTANGAGKRELMITSGGVDYAVSAVDCNQVVTHALHVSDLVPLSAGSYVELRAYQSSGGSLALNNSFRSGVRMNVLWERPL